MSEDVQGFRFRATPRVPFERDVRLRFDRIGGSVSGATADLSTEGMFVATVEYKPIGTLVQFEFENDAGETIQGLADIVWIRELRQGADREPGMGLHFRYVDPRSRELIAGVVRDLLAEKDAARELPGPPEAVAASVPPEAAAPVDETASSIVWSDSELPERGAPSQPAPSESPPATSEAPAGGPITGDEPAEVVPAGPEPEPLPPTPPLSMQPAAAGGGAVWTGSDEWLRPDSGAAGGGAAARGAAARRRSRAPVWWAVGALLVLVAGAAAIAYLRWQGHQGSRVANGAAPTSAAEPEPELESAVASPGDELDPDSEAGSLAPVGEESEGSNPEAATAAARPAAGGEADPESGSGGAEPATSSGEPNDRLVEVAEPAPAGGALRLSSEVSGAATVVRIAAPFELREGWVQSFRLDDPSRFVVRVRGASEAPPAAVESSLVRRIRIGVHEGAGEPEVHFVFDLAASTVGAQAAVIGGVVVVTFTE